MNTNNPNNIADKDNDELSDKLFTDEMLLSFFDGGESGRDEMVKILTEIANNVELLTAIESDDTDKIYQILMHSHDLLCRSVFRYLDVAGNFFENHLDPKIASKIDFSQIEYLAPDDIDKDLNERIGDLRFLVKCKPTESEPERLLNVTLIFEHQSTSDPLMSVRALELIARGFRQFVETYRKVDGKDVPLSSMSLPYPFFVILYNGKTPCRYKKLSDMIDIPEGFDKNILNFPTEVIDIGALTEKELNLGIPIVRALKLAFYYELKGMLSTNYADVLKTIIQAKNDIRVKDLFRRFLRYIVANCIIWLKDIESIERIYSVLTQTPEEAKAMSESFLATILKKGRLEGREEGREEGRLEGRNEGREEGGV
ncbi:MAG: Rpn family recombination-promoting nuclease/putative transposase, partial [Planctomycetaceae bacterium]|nr:Rpn family recombination-promoting nuclease/putative transposase [Planctomycetaceae bacterium]